MTAEVGSLDSPLTIEAAANSIRRHELTPPALLAQCLDRISAFDPAVRAWVIVDRDGASRQAERLKELLDAGQYLGPLHGIPVGIKDFFDVAGLPTRAGSSVSEDAAAATDAIVVARLRAAGAVIVGKTVTSEWAFRDSPPTRNPWNIDHTPGGSSSGSAAAMAMRMCLAALGTQAGGSTIRPATYCGDVGFKPTFGILPLDGVVPLSAHLDHVGLITGTVADMRLLYDAIRGAPGAGCRHDEALARHRAALAEPLRLGVLEDERLVRADDSVLQVMWSAIERLRRAGATTAAVRLPDEFDDIHTMNHKLLAVDGAQFHWRQFALHRDRYGPRIAAFLEEGLATQLSEYSTALWHQRRLKAAVDAAFSSGPLAAVDALILPGATCTAPPTLETTGNSALNSPWTYIGLPVVSIPCGQADGGMPVGIQLVGRRDHDDDLLAHAVRCERILEYWATPGMLAATEPMGSVRESATGVS